MCGIAGFFSLAQRFECDPDVLYGMARQLKHRGPDAEGIFQDSLGGLAFRRLSIIDLENGNQPLANEDGSVILICNGEIFNYHALRAEMLASGHSFRTNCDVEVLIHLYEEHGPAMLGKINGQFAFAILDRGRRQLFLARDHAGIAPLYYIQVDDLIIFASEIKAILEHPAVERKVDLTGLDQIFTFPGLVSPQTMFHGIERLRPGHYLLVNETGCQEIEYWDLDYPLLSDAPVQKSEAEYTTQLKDLFCQSIRYRLQADVPVGVYLSGGLDSSLIATFMDRIAPGSRRHAFGITFSDEDANESRYQEIVARSINCEFHQSHFDWNRTADMIQRMIYHAECPVKETYNTCSMALSQAAQEHNIKVILTGEGADELFAGYIGYRFDQLRTGQLMDSSPAELLEQQLRLALWGDCQVKYEHDYYAQRKIRQEIYAKPVQECFPEFDCLNHPLIRKDRIQGRHRVNQRSYLDFKLRMADHLLIDHGDCMALANSVEVRYPFLDIDLIEFAKQIPPELKLHNLQEKYILRRMGLPVLPKEILNREKFGWYAPGSPEMLQEKVEWIHDFLDINLIRRQGYFNPDTVNALKKHYSQSGFKLNYPFESDWLMVVATFGVFKEVFKLPDL